MIKQFYFKGKEYEQRIPQKTLYGILSIVVISKCRNYTINVYNLPSNTDYDMNKLIAIKLFSV